MKRLQLFEFEDFPWFPGVLRGYLTNYLASFHRFLGTESLLLPLLERGLAASDSDAIVDLCSGAGGPMVTVAEKLLGGRLRSLTLTDRYPNRAAAARINAAGGRVCYREVPVDAASVPAELTGMRTMIASFHHMPPPVAKAILADAFQARRPFCLYELSDNAAPAMLWWLPLPINTLVVLFAMPFVRPWSFGQLFFTYGVPILPGVIAWDGTTSNARTYTPADLRELTADLQAPDYVWEIGVTTRKGYPGNASYLLGLPSRPGPTTSP